MKKSKKVVLWLIAVLIIFSMSACSCGNVPTESPEGVETAAPESPDIGEQTEQPDVTASAEPTATMEPSASPEESAPVQPSPGQTEQPQATALPDGRGSYAVDDMDAKVGDVVSVPVRLVNNPGLISIRFYTHFDSERLKLVSYSTGNVFPPHTMTAIGGSTDMEEKEDGTLVFQVEDVNNPFVVRFVDGTRKSNITADGTLIYLNFQVLAEGDAEISIEHIQSYNYEGQLQNFVTTTDAVIHAEA